MELFDCMDGVWAMWAITRQETLMSVINGKIGIKILWIIWEFGSTWIKFIPYQLDELVSLVS
jgi:hypothetical protein